MSTTNKVALMKQLAVGLAMGAGALCAPAQAAPTFQIGVENIFGFHGVGQKTNPTSPVAVGDILYGVVNTNNIYTYAYGTSWNDNNTGAPYDTLTGYFAAKVSGVTSTSVPGFGTLSLFTFSALGSGDTDPGGVLTASDIASKTAMKFFTDTTTRFETDGSLLDDIAKSTDGTLWASFGFEGGYWTATISPSGNGMNGGLNFVTNNTGLSWTTVSDSSLGCTTPGGCQVDLAFESSFNPISESVWSVAISDPGRMHPVPLPAAAWLLISGLAGLAGFVRRRG